MRFFYAVMHAQTDRDAVFHRMQAEGLTACAMSSVPSPRLEQWRHITAPEQGVLLGCYTADADQASPGTADPAQLLACAMFSPRRGRVWEFDFTTFRHAAALAVPMARGGLAWAFKNLNCSAVMGLCPAPQPPRMAAGRTVRLSRAWPPAPGMPARPQKNMGRRRAGALYPAGSGGC